MATSPLQILLDLLRGVPREAVGIGGFAAAILAVVALGGAMASLGAPPPAWLIGLSYYGPGALAFFLYWTLTRRD